MSNLQLFITGILTLLSFELNAQEKDSVVSIHSIDYIDGGVQSSYTNVITYRKGKEVSNVLVGYWGTDIWRDSTTTLTTYGINDTPLLRTTKNVSYSECDQEREPGSVWSLFPVVPEDSVPKAVQDPYFHCRIYSYDTTVFSDTMDVTTYFYKDHNSEIVSNDTVFYYPDHLVKMEREYSDGKLNSTKQYRYTYDGEGRPVKTFTQINNWGIITSVETHQAYYDEKPFETYRKSFSGDDSLHFRSFKRMYDKHFNQIAYIQFENGVFSGSGTSPFSEDGHMIENNTYNADSTLRDHHEYHWKVSPNTTELWISQNYKHSTELNGFGYARYDTIRTPATIEVRISGRRIENPKHRFNSYKAQKCGQDQVIIYDRQKRYLEIKNFDENGKISSFITYSYSKN